MKHLLVTAVLTPVCLCQTTWYVDDDGTPPGSGTANDPYTSIQYAIDQTTVLDGDTLLVHDGVYSESVDFGGKTLTLASVNGPANCVVDAGGADHVLTLASGEGPATTVQGLTLRNGAAAQAPGGGGIYCIDVDAVFIDCIVEDNGWGAYGCSSALEGGGAYLRNSSAHFTGCVFRKNTAQNSGAGLYVLGGTVTLSDCLFALNGKPKPDGCCEPWEGGGVFVEIGTVALDECDITGNYASQVGGGCWGNVSGTECLITGNRGSLGGGVYGGIYTDCTIAHNSAWAGNDYDGCGSWRGGGAAYSVLVRCSVYGNEAPIGGGLCNCSAFNCTVIDNVATGWDINWPGQGGGALGSHLYDCVVLSNTATAWMPALELSKGGGALGSTLWRCVVSGNSADEGGGVLEATVRNCTIVGNVAAVSGGGVVDGDLSHTIVYGNTPDDALALLSAEYCDIGGGWPGVGNFDLPPTLDEEFHPYPNSPCVDAGDPFSPPDSDGSPPDVGAFTLVREGVQPYCHCAGQAPCGNEASADSGCLNSTGAGGRLVDVQGTTSVTADNLVLQASNLPSGQFGLVFMGDTAALPLTLGDGQRCVSGPLWRFAVRPVDPLGLIEEGPGIVAWSEAHFSNAGWIEAGSTWQFQAWFRDPPGPCGATSNTTSAVSVTFTP